MDEEERALVEQELAESERVDESRIRVVADGDGVALEGAVASPEEADAAALVAERHSENVVNRLRVDPLVREGIDNDEPREEVAPAQDEILVGGPDPLAGPDATITSDSAEAFSENEPWNPPDEPVLAATAGEYENRPVYDGDETVSAAGEPGPAAADLTEDDLARAAAGGDVPYLAPGVAEEAATLAAEPAPDGLTADDARAPAPDEDDRYPSRLPGATPGTGVMGEGTVGGGGLSGVPGTETGSKGADTAPADPARSETGSTAGGTGTRRGPEAQDDPALREQLPTAQPED